MCGAADITCKMYVLHTDRHLRRSINLDTPVVEFGDAALPLAKPEAEGRERREYSPVIGRVARGSRKFRRRVPSSQVGWEDGDLSVVSAGAEVRQRTAVRIACMLLVFCKCSLSGVATCVPCCFVFFFRRASTSTWTYTHFLLVAC